MGEAWRCRTRGFGGDEQPEIWLAGWALVRYAALMRTATVADLRNHFPKVVAWLDQGEEVEILRRGKPVACLVRPRTANPAVVPKIDFAAQNKMIWGDRVFSMQEVEEMRAFELEGEEG